MNKRRATTDYIIESCDVLFQDFDDRHADFADKRVICLMSASDFLGFGCKGAILLLNDDLSHSITVSGPNQQPRYVYCVNTSMATLITNADLPFQQKFELFFNLVNFAAEV